MSDPQADAIAKILSSYRTFAVVGCSPDPSRDSHRVARFLKAKGYRIVPVHPSGGTILGER
jgi:predicted CoA-binding protein